MGVHSFPSHKGMIFKGSDAQLVVGHVPQHLRCWCVRSRETADTLCGKPSHPGLHWPGVWLQFSVNSELVMEEAAIGKVVSS